MTRLTLLTALQFACLAAPPAAALGTLPALRGAVTDSIRHVPLAGATVIVSWADGPGSAAPDVTTTTDARGRFVIDSLPPGVYVVTLAVPSSATIRALFCPIAAPDSTLGLVAGYVKDVTSDHPVAGARVVFAWDDFDVDPLSARANTHQRLVGATSGPDGTFRMCGLPVERPLLVQAQVGAHEATGAVEVRIPPSGVLVETLRIDASPSGTAVLTGNVRRSGSDRPIAGAHVHL